jgi:E3 ubiquitin-protein ligase BAH
LLREGFPPEWVEAAVPYGPLKKVIKKVRKELEEIGFNPSELRDGVAFQYDFDGEDVFTPKFTVYFEGEEPVDASLSEDTREILKTLVANRKMEDEDSGSKSADHRTESTKSVDVGSMRRSSSVLIDGSNPANE